MHEEADAKYDMFVLYLLLVACFLFLVFMMNFIGFKRIAEWIFNALTFRWVLWIIIYCRFKDEDYDPTVGLSQVAAVADATKKADEDFEEGNGDPFKKKE